MSPQPVPLLGRLAVHLKMITPDQLAEVTRAQARAGTNVNLGQLMLQQGLIDEAKLAKLVAAQKQVVAKQRAKHAAATANPTPEAGAAAAKRAAPAPARAPAPAAQDDLFGGGPDTHTAGEAPAEQPSAAPAVEAPEAPRAPARVSPAGGNDPTALIDILRQGIERGASDIHIHSGVPLRLRRAGAFELEGDAPFAPEQAEALIRSALDAEQQALFDERGELDLALAVEGLGRFRVNVYRQQRGCDGVFRHIPTEVPTLEDLGLPASLARFTNYHQGMVLVTGPANCGKSSTLAALVRILNEERRDHILTIEDPVEYVHPSNRCVVNQRSVGPHTTSFARALRGALREDPDVIVIGELRDFETISLALTAAETGHLVLGTLHTNSTIRTINRIVGVFPADQQEQVRNMVSESLRAVVSQRLVPTADGERRVPALEVLVINRPVGNLIRENKTFQILSQLQMGSAQGMCLMDDSLSKLVKEGVISKEEALLHCEEAKRITG